VSAPAEERLVGSGMRLDFEHLRPDVEALAAMDRASAAADAPQPAWLERRLRDSGAHDIHTESFRYQSNWAWRHGAHAAAGVAAAAAGGPAGAALAAAVAGSYELEASGRAQWTSGLLPSGEGTNVVARVPAGGPAERTLVIAAHHDAARTGLLWRSPLTRLAYRGARERGGPRPMAASVHAALAVVALGCLGGVRAVRAGGAAVLGALALLGIEVARNRAVPGANDNATGVAALLALVAALARDPLERTDVIAVFTDCEETGMGGMGAWLRAHRAELDPATTLVLGLDTLGAGEPAVVTKESPLLAVYRDENLQWADRGALRAAVAPPARTSLTLPTDPIVARHAGLRAISIVSIDERGTLGPGYHLPSDTPDQVDWASVEQCTRLAGGIARVWDAVS
jgi:acetylornithine deacetylase/succinyl-diaminopimelate desuccinylase-like protein